MLLGIFIIWLGTYNGLGLNVLGVGGIARVAHELAHFARNISQDLYWMEDVPPIVREALYQDVDFSN